MPNDKSPPEPETVTQQETGGDCVSRLVRLRTVCGRELWSGFFGINENGDQPECYCEITEDVEEESLERDEDGAVRPCYSVECPSCGGLLEWPHEWEIIETNI